MKNVRETKNRRLKNEIHSLALLWKIQIADPVSEVLRASECDHNRWISSFILCSPDESCDKYKKRKKKGVNRVIIYAVIHRQRNREREGGVVLTLSEPTKAKIALTLGRCFLVFKYLGLPRTRRKNYVIRQRIHDVWQNSMACHEHEQDHLLF